MPVFVIGETPYPPWAQWEEGSSSQPTLGTRGCLQMWHRRALSLIPTPLCGQGQPLGAWWGRAWQPGSLTASTRTATFTESCLGATPWWVSTGLGRGAPFGDAAPQLR